MKEDQVKEDNQALRFNMGKVPMHLVPPDALLELVKVYQEGAKKYAPRNWERGMDWSKCFDSLMRHALAWQTGQDRDDETGLLHMAHAAWNAIALVAYHLRNIGIDDRHFLTKVDLKVGNAAPMWGDALEEMMKGEKELKETANVSGISEDNSIKEVVVKGMLVKIGSMISFTHPGDWWQILEFHDDKTLGHLLIVTRKDTGRTISIGAGQLRHVMSDEEVMTLRRSPETGGPE